MSLGEIDILRQVDDQVAGAIDVGGDIDTGAAFPPISMVMATLNISANRLELNRSSLVSYWVVAPLAPA